MSTASLEFNAITPISWLTPARRLFRLAWVVRAFRAAGEGGRLSEPGDAGGQLFLNPKCAPQN